MASAGLHVSMGVCLILTIASAAAAPVVIFDGGDTKPMPPYYESLAAGAGKGLQLSCTFGKRA